MRAASLGRVLGVTLALSTLLILQACNGSDERTSISREEYIDLYVEILTAADAAPDSIAASDSARAILARRGLSEDALTEFASQYQDDPGYLAEIWMEIETRLRNPPEPDSSEARPEVQ